MFKKRHDTDGTVNSASPRVAPCPESSVLGMVFENPQEKEVAMAMETDEPTAPPVQQETALMIVSDEAMDAIVTRLGSPDTTWQSVVAELDTVCIQSEGKQSTLLHTFAGETNARGFTAYLLDVGVPVNVKNNRGHTALRNAAMKGDLLDCKLLSEYGADLNAGLDFDSPMCKALLHGYQDVVAWLLDHPDYRQQWSSKVFAYLCEKEPHVVVSYLNLFAMHLERGLTKSRPIPKMPKRMVFSASMYDDSKFSVYYFELAEIYGQPSVSVASTALAMVVNSTVACNALGCDIMRYIIKAKWLAFGKQMFWQEVLLYLSLLTAFSVSVVCEQATDWNRFHSSREYVMGISRIVAAATSTVLLVHIERREVRVEGPAYFSSFWNLLSLGSYISVVLVTIYQACGFHSELLQATVGVLNVMLWVNMFQYLQMAESVAVLITIMSHMVRDVAKFILLYCVFLFGFSGGFYVLLFSNTGYETFIDALITVLLMLFGQITYDPFNAATGLTWVVSNLLLLAYLVSVVIVLLNLLIAMMSTSYSNVWEEAEGQVLLSYAQAILRMEKSITKADRAKLFEKLKTDAEARRKKLTTCRWWVIEKLTRRLMTTVKYVEKANTRSKELLSDPTVFSLAKGVVAFVQYIATGILLGVYSLYYGSKSARRNSLSPLVMNAVTRCSTLEDGERYEVVRKRASTQQQVTDCTRTDKLTALVEQQTELILQQTTLIRELSEAMRSHTVHLGPSEL